MWWLNPKSTVHASLSGTLPEGCCNPMLVVRLKRRDSGGGGRWVDGAGGGGSVSVCVCVCVCGCVCVCVCVCVSLVRTAYEHEPLLCSVHARHQHEKHIIN